MVALNQTVFANLFIQIISPIQIFEDLFCHNNMVTFIRNGVSCLVETRRDMFKKLRP